MTKEDATYELNAPGIAADQARQRTQERELDVIRREFTVTDGHYGHWYDFTAAATEVLHLRKRLAMAEAERDAAVRKATIESCVIRKCTCTGCPNPAEVCWECHK